MKRTIALLALGGAAASLTVIGIASAHESRYGPRDGAHHRGGEGRDGGVFLRRGMERLLDTFDANGDGGLTQEEIDTTRANRLAQFDADQNGSLSLEEFEALWLDAMRERMIDRFQAHDDDGDGQVTAAEFGEEFAQVVNRRDRNGDGILNVDDFRRGQGPRGAAPDAE